MAPKQATDAKKKQRRLLLVGVVALLPLMGFAGAALLSALAAYRTIDNERLQYTARAVSAAVDAKLGIYITALEVLATSRLLDGPLDVEAFEARARGAGEPLGGGIVLIDAPPDLQMLANTRRQPGGPLPRAVHPEGEAVLEGVFATGRPGVSDLFTGAVTGRPTLAIMVAVDRPGQPRRVLALAVTPAALNEMLAQQGLPPGTFAAIADGRFRIIARSFDPEGRRVGASAPDWVQSAVADHHSTLVVGPGWKGHDNIYAVERLTRVPGWTVAVAAPQAAQHASAWAAVRWLVAGGTALGLGMVVVAWAIRREAVRDAWREADALRAGRAEVQRLLGGLPAVVFLREVAPDGTFRTIYRGGDVETVLGWPAKDLASRQDLEGMIHLEHATLGQLGLQLLRDGHLGHEWRMRQPGGDCRTLHTLAHVLSRRPDGGAEVVGYTVDISARREAEARALASARLASVGEMAAGLAHEIRQPLQVISLAAELAQMAIPQGKTEQMSAQLEKIIQQTARTSEMIEHVRRFARGADSNELPEAVPLSAAIQATLQLTRTTLRDALIEVEVALDEPAPVVRGHSVLLEQVLSNLLLNARDALVTRPVGAPRRIRIASEPGSHGMVRLTLADTGGGISPEVIERLFEPFVTTKGPDKGTGLGLSICHGLIKGMGGRIEAHNTNEGAVFTIILPRALPDRDLAADREDFIDGNDRFAGQAQPAAANGQDIPNEHQT